MRYVKVKVVCFDEQVGKMSTKHFLLMQSHSLTQRKKFMKQFILSCHIR